MADVKHKTSHLPRTIPKRDVVIYKMHGDAESPDEAVIAKNDYQIYMQSRGPFVTALSGELVSKTFLFLGFSFSDPNPARKSERTQQGNTGERRVSFLATGTD